MIQRIRKNVTNTKLFLNFNNAFFDFFGNFSFYIKMVVYLFETDAVFCSQIKSLFQFFWIVDER